MLSLALAVLALASATARTGDSIPPAVSIVTPANLPALDETPTFLLGDVLISDPKEFAGLTLNLGDGQKAVIDELTLGLNRAGGLCTALLTGRTQEGKEVLIDERERCTQVFDDLDHVSGFYLPSSSGREVTFVETIYFGINPNGDLAIVGLTGTRSDGNRIEALPDVCALVPTCGNQTPTISCTPDPMTPCGTVVSPQCATVGGHCTCQVGSGFCLQTWVISCPGDSNCVAPKICLPSGVGQHLSCSCQDP